MLGRGGRTALLAALVAAAMFIVPSVASAAVLCVGTSGGACTQAEPDLNTALSSAHDGDTIQLGAGTYMDTGAANSTQIALKGVGVGGATGTTVTAFSYTGVTLELAGAGSSASDLEVLIPSGAGSAITGLEVAGSASNVAVVAASGSSPGHGVALEANGSSFSGTVNMSAAGGGPFGIVVNGAGTTVSGATISGTSVGIFYDGADSASVTGTRIVGTSTGIEATGISTVSVKDSLIALASPCTAGCTPLYAADSTENAGEHDEIDATQDTLVAGTASGGGAAGSPATVETQSGESATIALDSTASYGFAPAGTAGAYGLNCTSPDGFATMSVRYSSFDFDDTVSGADSLGNCDTHVLDDNQNQGGATPVAPIFANVATGDYHPTFNSPLVDAGDPSLSGGTDLDGNPRIVDGSGDGTARTDIGAFEYQRGAPTARIAAPTPGTTGVPITFDATTSSDPNDGEALSYSWKFDDGTTATGAVVAHTFASAGTHSVTLTVSEPNGLTATASASVVIALPQPVISGLKLSHSHFARGKKPASIAKAKPPATTISFSLSEAATVTFSFEREQPGRMKGTSCLAPTRARRHLHACTRDSQAGSFSFALPAGAARISFDGILPQHTKLVAGKYGLTLVAQASSGPPSAPAQTSFKLTR